MDTPEDPVADLAALVAVVDANEYLVLATADEAGRPWATPVWFATADHREYFWVSSPETQHSRNLAVRPELAVVVFDSRQRPGTGTGVYLRAVAGEVPDDELDRGLAVFSAAADRADAGSWGRDRVTAPAKHRLYRAVVVEQHLLDEHDERVRIPLPGST